MISKLYLIVGSILILFLFVSLNSSNDLYAASATPTPKPAVIADFAVTTTAEPGGKISPPGTRFAYGASSFTFTITPDPGYRIENVTVDGTSQGSISTYRFIDAQVSHEIITSFTPNTTPGTLEIFSFG